METQSKTGVSSPRILIVRLSAIGDVIHGLPVLNALRERFPQAFLAWLVEEKAAALLKSHQALNELITVPRGWLKSPSMVWRVRRQLRQLQFDVAIDIQGLTKSAVGVWLSGAKRRIGFGDEKGRELSQWFYSERVRTTARHVIECNLAILRPLGIESPTVRYEVPELECDRVAAQGIIRQAGLETSFGLINPGAGSPSRLWPPERFAAVARHLGQAQGLPTMVVWAGNQERQWAEQIAAGSQGHAQVAPPTTLTQLAALARRARLFVSSDTGPLHIAEAVGTPCVGLYGPWPAERNGPYGPLHIALQERTFEGSTRQRRNAPRELIEAITIPLVCQACDQILGRKASHAA